MMYDTFRLKFMTPHVKYISTYLLARTISYYVL